MCVCVFVCVCIFEAKELLGNSQESFVGCSCDGWGAIAAMMLFLYRLNALMGFDGHAMPNGAAPTWYRGVVNRVRKKSVCVCVSAG